MVDRIRPLKWETDTTGTENDEFQTLANPAEDHVDTAGVVIQRYVGPGEEDHTNDEVVRIYRDDSDPDCMMFKDGENTTAVSLSDLASGGFDINNVVWDTAGGIVFDSADQAVTVI